MQHFSSLQEVVSRRQLNKSPFFPQPMNRFVVMLQRNLLATYNIGWGVD